jgi:undecaprenyl-diphosphatase
VTGRPAAGRRAAGRRALSPTGHLLIALAGLVVVVVCGLVVRDGTVGTAERDAFDAVNDLPGFLYPVLWPFQQFGNLVVALAAGLIVAIALRRWWVAAAVVAAVGLKLLAEDAVKSVVERSRPGTSIGGDIELRGDVSDHGLSFVSGHAVITTAVAGLLTPILPRRWKPVPWVVVALNGFTRVYVGAHNPLDVVGGIGLGLVIAGVLNALLVGRRGAADAKGEETVEPSAPPPGARPSATG